jgi:hypothetical protein
VNRVPASASVPVASLDLGQVHLVGDQGGIGEGLEDSLGRRGDQALEHVSSHSSTPLPLSPSGFA